MKLPRPGTQYRVAFDLCACGPTTALQVAEALDVSHPRPDECHGIEEGQSIIAKLRERGLLICVGYIKQHTTRIGVYRATEAALALLPEQRRAA